MDDCSPSGELPEWMPDAGVYPVRGQGDRLMSYGAEPPTSPPEPAHEFERDVECETDMDEYGICDWHGPTTVIQMHSHDEELWECPRCGTQHSDPCSCGRC